MNCRKCQKAIPDGAPFCPWCGTEQTPVKHRRTRGNGAGTIFRHGKCYCAQMTTGRRTVKRPNGQTVVQYTRKTKSGFKTKAEADAYLHEIKNGGTRSKLENATFAQIYENMIDRQADRVGKDTINCYKAAYKYYAPLYGMFFRNVVTADMQSCIDSCPHGKRTRENMKALGTLMYTYALEQQVCEQNYAKYLWIPPQEQATYNAFPADTLGMLVSAAKAGDRGAMLIACHCYVGYRPSAFVAVKKSDYDAVNHTIIGGSKTEAGRNLVIPISSTIQPIIDQLLTFDGEYLFSLDGSRLTDRTYREECFYPTLSRLGIQPIPKAGEKPFYMPYSCRHTFATKMKNAVGSDRDKAALMGHTSYEMTLKYQHEDLTSMRNIIDQF